MIYTEREIIFQKELFNAKQFATAIKEATDTRACYREQLRKAKAHLFSAFKNNENINLLVRMHAWLIDQFLSVLWCSLLKQPGASNISLVAVGGYGRLELHPYSDIDILLLLKNQEHKHYQEKIEQFITFLWDINLQVSHSVRTIKECKRLASQSLSVMTNLLESRTLCGPKTLIIDLMALLKHEQIWTSRAFLQAKLAEQKKRHEKFNHTEYHLEPNLKSSPGGLRDLHTIDWLCIRHFGLRISAQKLIKIRFLTLNEHKKLLEKRAFLWKIRWALHELTGRAQDQLLFDYQQSLAQQFGFQDKPGSLAIEQLMQSYYLAVMTLGQLSDMLLQHFDDHILTTGDNQIYPIDGDFQVRNNYLEVTHSRVFVEKPHSILKLFLLLGKDARLRGLKATTIRLLCEQSALVNENFRAQQTNKHLFLSLLQHSKDLANNLRRLARYGILGRYIPEFGKIIGQVQHDLFHIYTVDAHSILLIQFIQKFHTGKNLEPYPLVIEIFPTLPKPWLLYIAGLFHDIGKGRPGRRHSEEGARDVKYFCLNHGLSTKDQKLATWLVLNHLLFSTTAQREDLSNPEVINRFAQNMGSFENMNYLYCLTIADINATNPKLWNSWRSSLLVQLYQHTKEAFARGLHHPLQKGEKIRQKKILAERLLTGKGIKKSDFQNLWKQLGNEYFLYYNAEEISWQAEHILVHKVQAPLIVFTSHDMQVKFGAQFLLYTQDKKYLFVLITTILERLKLSVLEARILLCRQAFSLFTFSIMPNTGFSILERSKIARIKKKILHGLAHPNNYKQNTSKQREPRALKFFHHPATVKMRYKASQQAFMVQITATDKPGLLALIGRTFTQLNLTLRSAKINTLGEKVEDIFFISSSPAKDTLTKKEQQTICSILEHSINNFLKKNQDEKKQIQSPKNLTILKKTI